MEGSASVMAFPSKSSITGGENIFYTALTPDEKTASIRHFVHHVIDLASEKVIKVNNTKTLATKNIALGKFPFWIAILGNP